MAEVFARAEKRGGGNIRLVHLDRFLCVAKRDKHVASSQKVPMVNSCFGRNAL